MDMASRKGRVLFLYFSGQEKKKIISNSISGEKKGTALLKWGGKSKAKTN